MLGEPLTESRGKRTERRALSIDGGFKVEVALESKGKLLGVDNTEIGTYGSESSPAGSLCGEGQGSVITQDAEVATWKGGGVGQFVGGGALRGSVMKHNVVGKHQTVRFMIASASITRGFLAKRGWLKAPGFNIGGTELAAALSSATREPLRRNSFMVRNCVKALVSPFAVFAVFFGFLVAPPAEGQAASTAISGVYDGTYTCAIGPRTLNLSLTAPGNASLTGVFTFYMPPTSHAQAFSYGLNGTFDAVSGKFRLAPTKWEGTRPAGYMMVGMEGTFDPRAGKVEGNIMYGGCSTFAATRDPAASPSRGAASAPAAQQSMQPAQPPAAASAPRASAASTALVAPAAQPSAPAAAAGQSAPAQAQNQAERPYICSARYSDRQTSRTTFYRTGVFQAAASLSTLSDAWGTYLRTIYHISFQELLLSQCQQVASDPAGQQYTQTLLDQGAQANKQVIVHVDWKYTPDQATALVAQAAPAATAAQPPATAAAKQGTPPGRPVAYNYCFVYFDQNSPNNYASSVSAVPMRENDFAKFVQDKYQGGERGEKVTGSCYNAQTKAQAEAVKAQFESTWRPGHKWIETGWEPTTTPVASGKGIPSYCSGGHADLSHAGGANEGNMYFTGIFEIPPHTPLNPVINDFAQFVSDKYGERITGTVTCPSINQMEPEKQYLRDKSRYKIIDTGWTPKSLPAPSIGN